MGKVHWERHNAKPAPIKDDVIGPNLRLVVRERLKAPSRHERFVATIRYNVPPVPGKFVHSFAYGASPEQAELLVLASALDLEG